MDKDEPEKSKLFMSKNLLNQSVKDKSKDEEIKPSVYKIKKNNDSIDPLNPKKLSSKKILTQSNEESNNNNITSKEYEENNMYDEKIKSGNKRYNYFQNDEGYEDDEISENNKTPKEKPDLNYYIKKNVNNVKQEGLQLSAELNKMMQSTEKKMNNLLKKEKVKIKENENKMEDISPKKKKEIKEIEKFIEKEYIIHKKYINKINIFIILYSIGILLSALSCISCIILELYSNQDVLYIISSISFASIVVYILLIIFTLKDRKYVLFIINSKGNPEKIYNSKYRKLTQLFIYLFFLCLNYFIVFMVVNTYFLNNSKLSIKGKAYDIKQWIEIFSNKNYSEIMNLFERYNTFFIVCGWLNYVLMLFISIFQSFLLFNYSFMKSILQILSFFEIQGGLCQIYLSLHCYIFRDITSQEGIKISWVTPGTIVTGIISILLSAFTFYVFFMEYKKGINFLQIFCSVQVILLLVFTVGLGSIEEQFYSYKKAKCNSLFKFISEDYLIKNKFNGCTSKYLFTTDTLDNMQCPKERIMINWERTETLYDDFGKINNYDNNNEIINYNGENKNLFYGCINQSCCLQTYFDIKNKFDLLFILSIHQTYFFLQLFFISFYIKCKMDNNMDEERPEKINLLIFAIITLLIFFILLPLMITLPESSDQSKMNLIENNEVSESLSLINKDNVNINKDNLYKITNSSFNEVKTKIINNFKYNLVFDYLNDANFKYKLSYYEYRFITEGMDISINKNNIDIESNFFKNGTGIIKFKIKNNIINNIFEYFEFIPRNPLRNDLILNIKINIIFQEKNAGDKNEETNNFKSNYENITIYGDEIINNYDSEKKYSLIKIIEKEINFSIMDKSKLLYIKGNIINDEGNSIINIYNYLYSSEPIFSNKTETNGEFTIGPIYKLSKSSSPYFLNIEISKIKNELNIDSNNDLNNYDENYCKYYNLIKIDEYAFNSFDNFYSIKNINLPMYKQGGMQINGLVREYDDKEEEDFLSSVDIKLFYGEQINEALKYLELNSINLNLDMLDSYCTERTSTNSNGEYSLYIQQTGQYMLLFEKEDYYIEKYIFTIDDITQTKTLNMGIMQLIQLFNSGKIVVKLEWDLKPPDLDLICRFQVTQNYYCYTFFANHKCGETEFFIDNRFPEKMSSEIIEITEFSDYLYLFYVRKYFDNSNGKTQNELKIAGVENINDMNHTGKYILYNEYLNNTSANIYVYSNGYKIPAIKIGVPNFELNEINNKDKEYIYWAAFCINGKEGINSLKIINQFMQDEPDKNICKSFYDENNLVKF